jgi:hypothetical protein
MRAETETAGGSDRRVVLWWAALLAGAAIHGLLWLVSEPPTLFSDFYKAYFPAAELVFRNGPGPTWVTDDSAAVGFVNIPALVWPFVALVPLGEEHAAWAFFALGAGATAAAFVLLLRLAGGPSGPALAFLFLANGPLVNSLREGNTTHFVLLLLIAALLLWRGGRDFAAGLVLGLAAMIKLPLILLGAYFLLRGRWRIVAGGATAIAAVAALSLATFGLATNLGWYKACVAPFMEGAIAAFNVQSIDGFLMRLVTGANELDNWFPLKPSIAHRVARLAIVAALIIGAVWLFRRGAQARPPAGADAHGFRDFSIVMVIALVSTPVSWTHYYLLLLLPWGLYLGGRLALPGDAVTCRLAWASWLLCSLPVVAPPEMPDWIEGILSRTVVSAWLFGGFVLLAALARGALAVPSAPLAAAAKG